MTHFPPEEQAQYEAELRARFEANYREEIAFTGEGGDYTAVLGSDTTIYDDSGYVVAHLFNVLIDDVEELKRLVFVYHIGYREGWSKGGDAVTAVIRKVLGV